MATFAFTGASAAVPAYGQRSKMRFVGTWANGDTWSAQVTSTLSGDFTVGKGNIAGQNFFCGFKLRDRAYIGFGSNFALSQNGDVTQWEEQNTGSAVVQFLSQNGPQDFVSAFASFEGKLVVFGTLSSQIWQIDADPAQFVLLQTLDNTGTTEPLSVKSVGDLDVYYLDYSGVRSIKSKEQNLNAYVNDVGVAIDSLISEAKRAWDVDHLVGTALYDGALIPAVVEPFTKQYWISFNDTTYVLSVHPQSKILAWSTYKMTAEVVNALVGGLPGSYDGSGILDTSLAVSTWYVWVPGVDDLTATINGTPVVSGVPFQTGSVGNQVLRLTGTPSAAVTAVVTNLMASFTPVKYVVYNGRVYCRTSDGDIYRYSGQTGATYDRTVATVELPWLDLGDPSTKKQFQGLNAALSGLWTIYMGANPKTTNYTPVISRGSTTSPSMVTDSVFDTGHYPYSGNGTHLKIKAISGPNATAKKLSKLSVLYTPDEKK